MYSLVTKSPLDREKQSHFDLTITAKDAGQPPLSSEKTISVVVSDVNDNSPEFSLSPYTFYVAEANEPGTSVFSVKAFDRDEDDNALITYHILRDGSEGNKLSSFLNINSENGDILALKSFDFETVKTFQFQVVATDSGTPPNDHFRLEVKDKGEDGKIPILIVQKSLDREAALTHTLVLTAQDGGKPPKLGEMNILVNVLDINDNAPVFSQDDYSVMLNENVPIGTKVMQVNATDLDDGPNGEVVYSFSSIVNRRLLNRFEIDPSTGEITVKGLINYEEKDRYEIEIQASDKGLAPLTTQKSVIIKIVDVNDNAPEIEVTSFSSSIPEDSRPGTTVALISVNDLDSGLNGKVICSIRDDVPFILSPSLRDKMYSLVTKSPLDREKQSHYDLTITAKDAGQPPLSSEKTISVVVSDVNDNSPEFSLSPYTFYVAEANEPGTSVFSVKAHDRDEDDNALITYHILRDGNRKMPFLILQKQMDREAIREHRLVLTAVDGGRPARSGTIEILIEVLDVNDNSPVFTKDVYTALINENAVPGTLVTQVNATDLDEGTNGEIVYSFGKEVDARLKNLFNINQNTGAIKTTGVIDFEENQSFEIDIQASDKGSVPLTTDKSVIIKIIDLNDNPPEIEVTSFSKSVPEDSRIGTTVALISVNDLDSGLNGKVSCFLITKSHLDREEKSLYEFSVVAKDAGEPSLSSEKLISVVVSDVNDNKPLFSFSPYTFYISENNDQVSPIFSVSASDLDDGDNAHISYKIPRDRDGDSVGLFLNINSENGDILALKSFDFETVKTFQFQVVATDSGTPSLSSNVTVNVFILDQNDNAPVILYPVSSNGSAEGVEEIPRNVNAAHLVTKVRAYDADIGYNGQIRTLRSFTETDEAEQKLVILVKDNGNVSLSATATVIVKVVEPKEAFAASDVKSATNDDEESNVTFYLMITLASVSALFLISIIVLIAMQCSKSTDYTSKYLQETNYDGTLCHSIQYRSGEKRYMLVGPRMSIGSTIVPGAMPTH
uniref:Protocadherin 2 alpha a 15 n=1 Tax=Labrus bergylta TaxID=56723 RepID=A0A3Q3E511_9LABR